MKSARQPTREDHPSGIGAERGAEREADRDVSVRAAASIDRHILGQQLRATGKGDTLSDAEHESQTQKRGERADEAGEDGRDAPEREAGRDHALHCESLGEPARAELAYGVRPIK